MISISITELNLKISERLRTRVLNMCIVGCIILICVPWFSIGEERQIPAYDYGYGYGYGYGMGISYR